MSTITTKDGTEIHYKWWARRCPAPLDVMTLGEAGLTRCRPKTTSPLSRRRGTTGEVAVPMFGPPVVCGAGWP